VFLAFYESREYTAKPEIVVLRALDLIRPTNLWTIFAPRTATGSIAHAYYDMCSRVFQLATDPKAFARKMKAAWTRLGEDEPEDPRPTPENVEQLIETLVVEGTRRFVHATNLVVENIYKASASAKRAFVSTVQGIVGMMDKYLKVFQ